MSDTSSSVPASSTDSTPLSSPISTLSLSDKIPPSDEDKAKAADLKEQANKAFASNDFAGAATLYGQAIEYNPLDSTLFCNRAYMRMKLEEHGYAIDDATKAIALDPRYVKAYYRRALCYLSILKHQKAVADFKQTLKLDPNNKLARTQLEATQKLIRKIQFEQAIDAGTEKTSVERCLEVISEGGCDIEKDYAGPRYDKTSGMTEDFIDSMIEWFKKGKNLSRRVAWNIVLACYDIFVKEESLTEIKLPEGVTCDVIGDTHGQFYDLLHLLSLTGKPSEKHCLLFNGDFVDRGSWSVEVIMTLFAYKLLAPNRIFLNRGNHETHNMNVTYGFEGEVKHKHGELTYKLFSHVFTALPLATLVSPTLPPPKPVKPKTILTSDGLKRYFVVHGGLFSQDGVTLEDIRKIERIGKQPGIEGLMCELLWTDPQDEPGRGPSKRGVGIAFGPDVTRRWCELNKITGILRSHEVRQDGYSIEHDGLCTTVFSAPRYCDQGNNKGAFVRIDAQGEQTYRTFSESPHPPMRPMAYASAFGGGLMM